MLDHLRERRFPLAANRADIDLPLADEAVDYGAPADGADQDHFAPRRLRVVAEHRLHAGDPVDIGLQILRRADHARPVAGIDVQFCRRTRMGKCEAAGAGTGFDILRLPDGQHAEWKQHNREEKEPGRTQPAAATAGTEENLRRRD